MIEFYTQPVFGLMILVGWVFLLRWIWDRNWHVGVRMVAMLVTFVWLLPAGLGYLQFSPQGMGFFNNVAATIGVALTLNWIYPRVRANRWGRYGVPVIGTAFLAMIWWGTIQQVNGGILPTPTAIISAPAPTTPTTTTSTTSGADDSLTAQCARKELTRDLCVGLGLRFGP